MQSKHTFSVALIFCLCVICFGNIQKVVKYFKNSQEITKQEFMRNKRNGRMVTFENGVKIGEIKLRNGQKHEKCYEWFTNGRKKNIREYNLGKKNGRWIFWNQNGMRRSETNYSEDLKHGQSLQWHINGQKEIEGKYCKDKKEGRWLHWDTNGNLQAEELWKQGRLILKKDLVNYTRKSMIYYAAGQKRYQREYKGDLKHGQWIKWNINGRQIYVRQYKNGMRHGNWREWDGKGNIVSEEIWDNGRMVKKIN